MNTATQLTYDSQGNVTQRIVFANPTENAITRITQIPKIGDDGERWWWNISIERIGR